MSLGQLQTLEEHLNRMSRAAGESYGLNFLFGLSVAHLHPELATEVYEALKQDKSVTDEEVESSIREFVEEIRKKFFLPVN